MRDAVVRAASRGELDQRRRRPAQRIEVEDLRSDVAVQTDDLDALRDRGRGAPARATSSIGDAELVGLQACRDVRVAPRVDVGVHADGDPRAGLALARQRVDPLDLAGRLHVDRPDAELDRLRQLGGRLADAGEDDLRRDEPGAQRDVDLTAGVRIGVAAQRPQQPHDRERRVGLQRVMDRVRIGGEGLVDGPYRAAIVAPL